MGLSNAERQAAHRRRQSEVKAALLVELETLRAVSKTTTAPLSHDNSMEQRFRILEEMVQMIDRRLDQIEAMANSSY